MPRLKGLHPNVAAALDTIAFTEGTDNGRQRTTDQGYDVLVGGGLFTGYRDHPRRLIQVRPGLASTAAGRYQILSRFWDHYKRTLKLPDFGPESQDRYAVQQLREQRALAHFEAGRAETGFRAVANIWASLPGAGYGQHEYPMSTVLAKYREKGGRTI